MSSCLFREEYRLAVSPPPPVPRSVHLSLGFDEAYTRVLHSRPCGPFCPAITAFGQLVRSLMLQWFFRRNRDPGLLEAQLCGCGRAALVLACWAIAALPKCRFLRARPSPRVVGSESENRLLLSLASSSNITSASHFRPFFFPLGLAKPHFSG